MGKSRISKKTKIKKILICILYHDVNYDISNLIKKIKVKKKDKVLIVLDGIKNIKNKKKILKLKKNIHIIYSKKKINSIPFNRNLACKHAKKNYYIILFLDSDILPTGNIVQEHLKAHLINNDIPVIGGPVTPSFFKEAKSIWEILDGCLSWFTSQKIKHNKFIESPYHIPTCNMSIKVDFLKEYKLKFDNNLNTGEDADFCRKVRDVKKKILLINKAEILHKDRTNFLSFINHHAKWGRHQYYTLYRNNKIFENLGFSFYFLFFIFYPFFMPIINLYSTILTIYPWTKYRLIYILLLPPSYLVHLVKGLFTYLEFLFHVKKILVKLI
jgi:GT2 family glycosyltransferase